MPTKSQASDPTYQRIIRALGTVRARSEKQACEIVAQQLGVSIYSVKSAAEGRLAFQNGVKPDMPNVERRKITKRTVKRHLRRRVMASQWTQEGLRGVG